jgi:GAF domain-containing protein
MAFDRLYYHGFEKKWRDPLASIAAASGIESLLIMRSTPTHMVAVVSAGPKTDTYHPGDEGPKSVNPGCHKLYCEQVVNTGLPLHVPDAAADPEWRHNEDLVQFGLGVYLGYPIEVNGEVLGTICALHNEPYDFDAGIPSLRQKLEELRVAIQADLSGAA